MLSDSDLKEWWKWKQIFTEAKKMEVTLRRKICKELINPETGDGEARAGGAIYRAKAVINMSIDASALESIWDLLSDEEKALIIFKPNPKYAKIPEDSQLWDIITEKDGLPTLARLEE